ncbi:MAG: hypothetical protein ABIJ75_06220 [Actinomycetota bacterium]
MTDTVGVNYQWPKALHAARKLIAKYDGETFKASLFEAEAIDVTYRRIVDPELDRLLKEKGL